MSKKDYGFKNFLATRKQKEKCNHGEGFWCQNCIAKPQLVSQRLPDGRISKGYFITNHP